MTVSLLSSPRSPPTRGRAAGMTSTESSVGSTTVVSRPESLYPRHPEVRAVFGEPSQVGYSRLAHLRSDLGQARDRWATAPMSLHEEGAATAGPDPSRRA